MTDTTNNQTPDEQPEGEYVELENGRLITVADLVAIYEAMNPEQKAAVHFLVNAAQQGQIEAEDSDIPEEGTPEYEERLAREVEDLGKLSDTLHKARGEA